MRSQQKVHPLVFIAAGIVVAAVALGCFVPLFWWWLWDSSPPNSMNRPWPEWGNLYCFVLPIAIGTSVWCFVIGTRPLRGARPRGICAKCGYSLRGLAAGAKCPECGTRPARV